MKQHRLFGEYAKYTSLNILGMMGLSCYILADTFFVSKGLGTNGLTALNLAIPVYSFIHGSGLMLGMGGATRYSIFQGQNASEHSNNIFTGTIYLAVILAILFMLTGCFFTDSLTLLLGADAAVYTMTRTYLKVILLFSPAFLLNDIFVCFVRNDGNPRLSMLAMLMGSLSNIILDYILIFPCHMGILGAVLATGGAPVISMLILSRHWIRNQHGFHFKRTRPNRKLICSALSLGLPSLITEFSAGIVIIVFNFLLLHLAGNEGVAAYGIIANLSLVVTAVYTGIAQGIQPIISREYGYGNHPNTHRILGYGVVTMLILSALIYLPILIFPEVITEIFNSEHNMELQKISVFGLRIYFTAIPFAGFNIVVSSFFTSIARALPAHVISIIRGFALILPLAFVLSGLFGITGVWLTYPLTEAVVCMIGLLIYHRLSRVNPPRTSTGSNH